MKKNFLFFIFFLSSLYSKPLDLEISAKRAILINPENNAILFEKDAHSLTYPASITKVFTLWYISENFSQDLNKTCIATDKSLKVISADKKISSNYKCEPYILENDGVMFDIKKDERLSLQDLLYGMIVVSGCDSCNVAAENLSGSIDKFMKDLNEFLKSKDIKNTHLLNPHGLHMPDQKTTAFDIAFSTKQAIKNPIFLKFFSSKFFIRPNTNKQAKKEIQTFNKILKPSDFYYKPAIGSKTGYHFNAKFNLVTLAKKNQRSLIAVVLNCPSRDKSFEDTKKLFEKAFLEKEKEKIIMDKNQGFLAIVKNSSSKVKAYLKSDIYLKYYPSEKPQYKAFITFNENLKAPILKDEKIGILQIKDQNQNILVQENLFSKNRIRRSFFFYLKSFFVKS